MNEIAEEIISLAKAFSTALLQVFAWFVSPFLKWKYGLTTYSPQMSPTCYKRDKYPEPNHRTFYCMPCLDDKGKMSVIGPKGDEVGVMYVCPRCRREVPFNVHPTKRPGGR